MSTNEITPHDRIKNLLSLIAIRSPPQVRNICPKANCNICSNIDDNTSNALKKKVNM